jgi:hypothetical protein
VRVKTKAPSGERKGVIGSASIYWGRRDSGISGRLTVRVKHVLNQSDDTEHIMKGRSPYTSLLRLARAEFFAGFAKA